MSGEEVILTPESVAALSALEFASDSVTASPNDPEAESPPITPFTGQLPGYQFTTQAVPLTIVAGLQYNNTLDTYDPFSILPDMKGEPLPKQLLIRYCTSYPQP